MCAKILIIEDELRMQELLVEFLMESNYRVDCASDGLLGFNVFQNNSYDLIILDVMLPKIDGFAVLELIRKESDIPIIMLTALDKEDYQIKGFDLKADDYIAKPFSMKLLVKRVEAVLRRKQSNSNQGKSNILSYNDVILNTESCVVQVLDQTIPLTRKEYELIKLFLENKNHVFTREQLLNQVWGYDYFGDESVVNGHIKNIRKKLGSEFIVTVRGIGYKVHEDNHQ